MRKTPFPLLSVLFFIILAGWVGFSFSVGVSANSSGKAPGNGAAARMRGQPPSLPTGMQAIHPRTTNTGPSTPAFTVTDVVDFITRYGMPRNLTPGKITVIKVLFITSKEASALLGESTGLPDTTLMCYAELKGTFTFPGPESTTATFSRGFELFDAHTGNLLMYGGLP